MRINSAALKLAAAAAFSIAVHASSTFAQPCPLAFLSAYLTPGFSCELEDKTVRGFAYTESQGAPSPTVVTVVPDTAVLHNPGLIFNFTGVTTVPPGSTVTIPFGFNITAPANDPITEASLAVAGSVTGDGSIVDQETFNVVGSSALTACIGITGCSSSATEGFLNGTTNITVLDSATLVGGASDLIVTKRFSETPSVVSAPEPASLAVLGAALGALCLAWRRRRSTRGMQVLTTG